MKSGKVGSNRKATISWALGLEFALVAASIVLAVFSGLHLWGTTFAKKSAPIQQIQSQVQSRPGGAVQSPPVASEEKGDAGLVSLPGTGESGARTNPERYYPE